MTAPDNETLPSSPAANERSGGCRCFSCIFPRLFLSLFIGLINLFILGFSLLFPPPPSVLSLPPLWLLQLFVLDPKQLAL